MIFTCCKEVIVTAPLLTWHKAQQLWTFSISRPVNKWCLIVVLNLQEGITSRLTLPVKPPPPSPYPRLLCSTKYSLSFSVTHSLNAFFSRISSGLSHMFQTWRGSPRGTPDMSRTSVRQTPTTAEKTEDRRVLVSESLPSLPTSTRFVARRARHSGIVVFKATMYSTPSCQKQN